jgi:DNA-binding winged helix-turn-helix (wHTH) protein/class 3 adenylate cyclase
MRYVFGDCVLDTTRYILHRAGQPIQLRPKVFQLLVYLLTQRERVVSKQELSEQVWQGHCISDATLESTLAAARRALGGHGRAHGYIQTLHGHGYRFVVPVEEQVDPRPGAGDDAHRPDVDTPTTTPRKDLQTMATPALPAAEGREGGEAHLASPEPSLRAAEALPQGSERKLVTVLCCAASPRPGPRAPGALDTLHQQVQALYELVQREAQPYGGTMQPVLGEQVLVVFGAPAAQEDHAQRAVLVALGLRERLYARRTTAALPDASLVGRISLHTGPVAIGGLGDEPTAAAAVVGDTIGVAMALQERAAPGAVVCSATTARLVQGLVRLVRRACPRTRPYTQRVGTSGMAPAAPWQHRRAPPPPRHCACRSVLSAGTRSGRGTRHAPTPGALPSGAWHFVCQDRLPGASPC